MTPSLLYILQQLLFLSGLNSASAFCGVHRSFLKFLAPSNHTRQTIWSYIYFSPPTSTHLSSCSKALANTFNVSRTYLIVPTKFDSLLSSPTDWLFNRNTLCNQSLSVARDLNRDCDRLHTISLHSLPFGTASRGRCQLTFPVKWCIVGVPTVQLLYLKPRCLGS